MFLELGRIVHIDMASQFLPAKLRSNHNRRDAVKLWTGKLPPDFVKRASVGDPIQAEHLQCAALQGVLGALATPRCGLCPQWAELQETVHKGA